MARNLLVILLIATSLARVVGAAVPCNPIVTFADGKKPQREIFVSPNGNNFKGDGSRTSPFQTINHVLQTIRAGDAIRLLPGTYTNSAYLANISGTADAPIWLGGVPNEPRPIFTGPSASIHISRANYFILENIEVSGAKGNGINCDDGGQCANTNAARHIVLRNLFIHDTGSGGNQDGLKLSGLNDYFVLDCEFARISAGGSGIDHVGCHHGLIARCTFTEGGNSIQCKGGSEDIEIRSCRFVNPSDRGINIGGSTGFTLFRPPLSTNTPNVEAKNIRVIANLFIGGSISPVAFVGATDSLVANNTIIDPKRWILRILQETISKDTYTFLPCGRNQFINNLISYDGSQISVHCNVGSNTDPASFQFANNLWFDHHQPNRSSPNLPAPETDAIYALDAKFKNAASNDFTLQPTSPAVGKGKKHPSIRSDFPEGCYSDPPSIGAFEVNPRDR
jgi:hypothetical protein